MNLLFTVGLGCAPFIALMVVGSAGARPASDSQRTPSLRVIHFEENIGQGSRHAQYIARGPGFFLALHPAEIQLALGGATRKTQLSRTLVRVRLEGASAAPELSAESPLPGRINHFVGSDPARWRTNLATFARVRYPQVYPGIDLIYHGQEGELEYDFVVGPGEDPNLIRMQFSGLKRMELDASGDLILHIDGGVLRHRRPVIFQGDEKTRTLVKGRFVLHGDDKVGFEVGSYDRSQALVIDPILIYSTYLGSSDSSEVGNQSDWVNDITVDPSGYVYVTGVTGSSPDFPFVNPAQTQQSPRIGAGGGLNAFVARFRPDGQLHYATYLGGEKDDWGNAIFVDNANNAYVAGRTHSAPNLANPTPNLELDGFPTTPGAFGTNVISFNEVNYVGFLTKLNAAGQMVKSTLVWIQPQFNFNNYEAAAVVVDTQGRPTVVVSGGGLGGLLQLDAQFAAALRTNLLGSIQGRDLAIDSTDSLHLVGFTPQPVVIPTNSFWTEFFQSRLTGGFYQKYHATGSVVYAAVFPGGGAGAVAVNSAGHAFIVGNTLETLTASSPPYGANRWPVKGAFQSANRGGYDAFIFKIDPTKSGADSLMYASFLGGSESDSATGVDVDELDRIYVTGTTSSTNFPLASPLQTNLAGPSDAFVTELNAAGSGLIFSSYWGGSATDEGFEIAVGLAATDLYFAGRTRSTNFPTRSAVQGSRLSAYDGFVTRIQLAEPEQTFIVNSENDVDDGSCDTAHCSLREAIFAANSIPGRQRIHFADNVRQIRPQSALPVVIEPVVIESQSTTLGRPFVNGLDAGMVDGLVIRAGNSEVRRLAFGNFQGYGLVLEEKGTNKIESCVVGRGLDDSGPNVKGGIFIQRSHGNVIGSAQAGLGCEIAGNGGNGIHVRESEGTKILGCVVGGWVGFPPQVFGNAENGILIEYSTGSVIGDSTVARGQAPGNEISANGQAGIRLTGFIIGGRSNVIRGNIIGSVGAEAGNNIGVLIETFRNLVGGPNPTHRNLISGNTESGVEIRDEFGAENQVQGNWIGVGLDGNTAKANGKYGVLILRGSGNEIGGETAQSGAAPGNVISENGPAGFFDRGEISTANVKIEGGVGNVIAGNLIGPAANGDALRGGNQNAGVFLLGASDTVVGGDTIQARNIVSGNGREGIASIDGHGNRFVGNWIGVKVDGTDEMRNLNGGIALWNGFDEMIGGSTTSPGTAPGNVVAMTDVLEDQTYAFIGSMRILRGTRTQIRGNLVGTDATGTRALFRGADDYSSGITMFESQSWVIGGASPSERNIISGNYLGVLAMSFGASRNRIVGNFIGTDISGNQPLPNRSSGIYLYPASPAGVRVGGLEPGEGNVIAYNRRRGVNAGRGAGSLAEFEFSRNSIFENGELGIEDGGSGDNHEPRIELMHAWLVAGAVIVEGRVPEYGGVAAIELFSSPSCDPSGFGEGKTFFHELKVTTSVTEKMRFVEIINEPLALGTVLTATATLPPFGGRRGRLGGTTRFSNCRIVQAANSTDSDGVPDFIEDSAPNSGDGNGDGIKDRLQANVCTYQTWLSPYPTGAIEVPPEDILEDIEAPPDCEFDAGPGRSLLLPHGCLEYSIEPAPIMPGRTLDVGSLPSPVEVKVFLPAGSIVNRYFVFAPTPANSQPHWFNFEWDGFTGARFEPGLARVTFVDGGRGDSDGTMNGRIVTKGALVFEGSVPFRIQELAYLPFDQILLRGQVAAGTRLIFEKSADLRQWTPVSTNFVESGFFRVIDSIAPESSGGFYRAKISPP